MARLPNLILILILCLIGCGSLNQTSVAPAVPDLFTDVSQSPDTGVHQGYATDGTVHFLFDTHRILKRANDSTWLIIGVNDSPFAGLTGFDHIGDGDYFEGNLYVPVEQYTSCTNDSNPAVFVFDAASLVRKQVVDLPVAQEVSGVAVEPETRELWVSSYCDGSQLWVYDLDTFTLKRTVQLTPPVENVQGVAYRDGYLYIAENGGDIHRATLSGSTTRVFHTPVPGAHEGLDYSQPELRWLIDAGLGEQKIHFLKPN